MASTQISHLSLTGLQIYDAKIKAYIETKVNDGDAKSFKYVNLENGILKFYLENPLSEGATPAFEIDLPEQDLSHLMALVKDATENNVAVFDANGQVKDGGLAVADIATKTEVTAVADRATTLEGKVEALETSGYDDKEVRALIQANTDAIEAIEEDYLTSEDEIFVTDILTVNALGGIAANTDLNGMTTHAILNKLLYPYVAQVVGTPSRTPNSTVLERGNDQTVTAVSVSVTKKSEAITSVALYNGSTLIAEKTGDEVAKGGTFTFSGLSIAISSAAATAAGLTVKVTDASGNVVSKTTSSWNFVYPYYTGVCGASDEITEDLIEGLTKKIEVKGTKTWSFTADNQRCVIAYPKSYGVLKSAIDPNGFENISSFTQYEVNVTGLDGSTVAYYVYANGACTVSSFAFTFKY